jgi:hypothetical protein
MSRADAGWKWLPAVVLLFIGGVGYLPTLRIAGRPGVQSMLVALGLVLGAVYATMLRAMRRMALAVDAPQRFKAAFRAGVERFIVTLALAGAIAWRGRVSPGPFLVWVAVSYVVMIKIETVILIRWSRRLENRS